MTVHLVTVATSDLEAVPASVSVSVEILNVEISTVEIHQRAL